MKLPRGMDALQEAMREKKEYGPDFDLLTHIIEQYNEKGRTLDELATGLSISTGTLYSWLRQLGYAIEKKIIQVMVPAEGESG